MTAYDTEGQQIASSGVITVFIPKKASGVIFTKMSNKRVLIAWNHVKGATGYKIYRKKKGGIFRLIGNTAKTYYYDKHISKNKSYQYYITSVYHGEDIKSETDGIHKNFATKTIVNTSHQKYSYAEMSSDIKALQKTYANYCKVNVIGKSADNRNLYDMVIGNPKAKKTLLVIGALHAREYMTSQLCMSQIEYYLQNYNNKVGGVRSAKVLNKIAIHYVPMVNPDGVSISQFGIKSIRSSSLRKALYRMSGASNTSRWKANARGVDLNRNYACRYIARYGGRRGSEGYTGTHANSEPETKAIVKLINKLKKNTKIQGVISYHAAGSIAFGDGSGSFMKRTRQMYSLARSITGYADSAVYSSKGIGNLREYVMYKRNIPCITLEIGYGSCPLPLYQFRSVWNRNKTLVLREAKLFV